MSGSTQSSYELYQNTSVGLALLDAVNELVQSSQVEPALAVKIIQNFDKSFSNVFGQYVKANMHFKGQLATYSNCDDVWKFVVEDANFTMNEREKLQIDKVKIIACLAKNKIGG